MNKLRASTFLLLLVASVKGQFKCCNQLNISSSGVAGNHQGNRLGIYQLYDVQDQRPIYKQIDRQEFLFYLVSNTKGLWMIGPHVGQFNGGLAHRGDNKCVQNVRPGQWKYTDGAAWHRDSKLKIACLDPSVECLYKDGWELEGSDLPLSLGGFGLATSTSAECVEECQERPSCHYWTFVKNNQTNCFLKMSGGELVQKEGYLTGSTPKACGAPRRITPTLEQATTERAFVKDDQNEKFNDKEINGKFKITSLKWNNKLNDKNSRHFRDLSASIEDSLLDMFHREKELNEKLNFTVTVEKFKKGSVVCNFKVNYALREAYVAIPFVIKPSNITETLSKNFRFKKGILFQRFLIAAGSFNASSPVDHCAAKGCSHKCNYDYDIEDYVCTCPPSLALNINQKTCVSKDQQNKNLDDQETDTTTTEKTDTTQGDNEVSNEEEVTTEVNKKKRNETVTEPNEKTSNDEEDELDEDGFPVVLTLLPADCLWSPWSTWSDCSCSEGNGKSERTRDILMKERNGGSCPGEPKQTVECQLEQGCPGSDAADDASTDDTAPKTPEELPAPGSPQTTKVDENVLAAADAALLALSGVGSVTRCDENIELVEVVEAERQVVAGTNYILTIRLASKGGEDCSERHEKICSNIKVFQPLPFQCEDDSGCHELINQEDITCEGIEETDGDDAITQELDDDAITQELDEDDVTTTEATSEDDIFPDEGSIVFGDKLNDEATEDPESTTIDIHEYETTLKPELKYKDSDTFRDTTTDSTNNDEDVGTTIITENVTNTNESNEDPEDGDNDISKESDESNTPSNSITFPDDDTKEGDNTNEEELTELFIPDVKINGTDNPFNADNELDTATTAVTEENLVATDGNMENIHGENDEDTIIDKINDVIENSFPESRIIDEEITTQKMEDTDGKHMDKEETTTEEFQFYEDTNAKTNNDENDDNTHVNQDSNDNNKNDDATTQKIDEQGNVIDNNSDETTTQKIDGSGIGSNSDETTTQKINEHGAGIDMNSDETTTQKMDGTGNGTNNNTDEITTQKMDEPGSVIDEDRTTIKSIPDDTTDMTNDKNDNDSDDSKDIDEGDKNISDNGSEGDEGKNDDTIGDIDDEESESIKEDNDNLHPAEVTSPSIESVDDTTEDGSLKEDGISTIFTVDNNDSDSTPFPILNQINGIGNDDETTTVNTETTVKAIPMSDILEVGDYPEADEDTPITSESSNSESNNLDTSESTTKSTSEENPKTLDSSQDYPVTSESNEDPIMTSESSKDLPITTGTDEEYSSTSEDNEDYPSTSEDNEDYPTTSEANQDDEDILESSGEVTSKSRQDLPITTESSEDNQTTSLSNQDSSVTSKSSDDSPVTPESNQNLPTTSNEENSTTTESNEDSPATSQSDKDHQVTSKSSEDDSITTETSEDDSITTETSEDDSITTETSEDDSITTETSEDGSITTETSEDYSISTELNENTPTSSDTEEDFPITTESIEDISITSDSSQNGNKSDTTESSIDSDISATTESSFTTILVPLHEVTTMPTIMGRNNLDNEDDTNQIDGAETTTIKGDVHEMGDITTIRSTSIEETTLDEEHLKFNCSESSRDDLNISSDELPMDCVLENGIAEETKKHVIIILNKNSFDFTRLFEDNIRIVAKNVMLMDNV